MCTRADIYGKTGAGRCGDQLCCPIRNPLRIRPAGSYRPHTKQDSILRGQPIESEEILHVIGVCFEITIGSQWRRGYASRLNFITSVGKHTMQDTQRCQRALESGQVVGTGRVNAKSQSSDTEGGH